MSEGGDDGSVEEGLEAGRWRGYSCPGCHTLFRVMPDSAGRQVECPACGEISLIPGGEGSDRAEMAAGSRPGPSPKRTTRTIGGGGRERREVQRSDWRAPGPPAEGGEARVRRKMRLVEAQPEEFDWETENGPGARTKERVMPQGLIWGTVGTLPLLMVLGVGALVVMVGGGAKREKQEARPAMENDPMGRRGWDSEEVESDQLGVAVVEIESIFAGIEGCVANFLAAKSVEEMARFVRGGAAVRARMDEYYRRNPHAPTSYREIAPQGRVLMSGDLWSVDVILSDHLPRAIAVEETAQGFLVDWESWVGYSEMPWTEFLERRPTEAKLFRVKCAEVNYYNFDFTDDREWESFRLFSPDKEHTLYGYVPRYSVMGSLLRATGGEETLRAYLVKLRFPEGGRAPNQVLIDEVVGAGWVGSRE